MTKGTNRERRLIFIIEEQSGTVSMSGKRAKQSRMVDVHTPQISFKSKDIPRSSQTYDPYISRLFLKD